MDIRVLVFLSANKAYDTNGIRIQTYKEDNKYNKDKLLIYNGIIIVVIVFIVFLF